VIVWTDNARVIYTNIHCYEPGMFLGITPVASASNSLYFLTITLVSVMRVIYTSKGMSKILGCALYIRCALSIEKYGNCYLARCRKRIAYARNLSTLEQLPSEITVVIAKYKNSPLL
jgi:hypothetical protein